MISLREAHVGAKLFLRSLLPSPFSLAFSFLLTLIIIGGHMLMLSVSGTAYPAALNDLLLEGYANYIVGPLTAVINSNAVNFFLLIIFWGVIGLVVYEGLAHTASLIYEWRTMKEAINVPAERAIRRHPLAGYFVVHLVWRILVVFLSLVLTIVLLPIVHFILTNTEEMLSVTSAGDFLRLLGINVLWWLVIMHAYVVLLRWYVFRTRLTGEILY